MFASPAAQPEKLWHYTNTEGLLGILNRGILWGTDAEYLNDSQELSYARDHLSAEFHSASERLTAKASLPYVDDPHTASAAVLSAAVTALAGGDPLAASSCHVFVACFCEDGDLLSQWRGYASGSGFALAFETSALERAVLSPMPPQERPVTMAGLRPVSYGDGRLRREVEDLIQRATSQPSAHPYVRGDYLARDEILPMLAEFKHPAFAEEREWRLIATDAYGERVPFRSGPLGPTPFVEFAFGDALKEVKVGPGPHQELRQRAVRRLVSDRVDVTLSQAPFRG